MNLNQTVFYIEVHPCYKLNTKTYLLIDNPSTICILLHVVIGFLSFITICGNLLVIISIIYFRQLHTPTNYLILSLAVADFLVGLLVFPLALKFPFVSCMLGNPFCYIRTMFDNILCISSFLNLSCISIDRYYSVCQPLTYQSKITDAVVRFIILVS